MIISSKPCKPPLDAKWIIHIDGATLTTNPSSIGAGGFTVWVNGLLYHAEACTQIGSSNNRAEFFALLKALKWAHCHWMHDVDIRSDSDILVKWANGGAQLKDERLLRLAAGCNHYRQFFSYDVTWVSRTDERQAFTDYIAKLGLVNDVVFNTAKQHKYLIGAYYECVQNKQIALPL